MIKIDEALKAQTVEGFMKLFHRVNEEVEKCADRDSMRKLFLTSAIRALSNTPDPNFTELIMFFVDLDNMDMQQAKQNLSLALELASCSEECLIIRCLAPIIEDRDTWEKAVIRANKFRSRSPLKETS